MDEFSIGHLLRLLFVTDTMNGNHGAQDRISEPIPAAGRVTLPG